MALSKVISMAKFVENSAKPVQTDTPKNQNTTSNILAWYVNGQFDEFLMIMMLEMLVKLSNLTLLALESYKIRQIVHLQIKSFQKTSRPERKHSNVCQQKSFQPCFKGFQCLLPPSEQQWPDGRIKTTTEYHIFTKC